LLLSGLDRGVSYAPSSFGFDATGTILTVNYPYLPDDAYTFTLLSGPNNFTSLAGVPLQNSFAVSFTAPLGSVAYPTPLQGVGPAGGLVYQGLVDHVIITPGESDGFTLTLASSQTLTLVAQPATFSPLQPALDLYGPHGDLLGSATAGGAGAPAVIQTVPITGGTYTIQVSGTSSTTGLYTLKVLLNAAVENEDYSGLPDNTLPAAQSIDI